MCMWSIFLYKRDSVRTPGSMQQKLVIGTDSGVVVGAEVPGATDFSHVAWVAF